MQPTAYHEDDTARLTRLVCKLLSAILQADTFASGTDLRDVLWRRCHQLRIPATVGMIDAALARVGSHTALLFAGLVRTARPPEGSPLIVPLTHAQASTILRDLNVDVSTGRVRGARPHRAATGPAGFRLVEVR